MIRAIFRVMALGLFRDRAALSMAFALPPLIYIIFAAIFAGATGGDLRLKVVVFDTVKSALSQRLTDALQGSADFRVVARAAVDTADAEAMVRRGEADVGIIVLADPDQFSVTSGPAVRIIADPARAMAGPIATGHVLRLYREKLPDAAYRRTIAEIEQRFVPLMPAQRQQIDAVLQAMQTAATKSSGTAATADAKAGASPQLITQSAVVSASKASATIVYYAGAVGFMFLLFSAMQGSMTLIDERNSGITARLLSGPATVATILSGKFLFLLLQGVMQIGLIFIVAALAYGVDVGSRFPEWLVITLASSAAAASLALALSALCRTRQQATTMSNFLVLVLSALGGSMVPRFMMPPWLQDFSWVIPNAWAVEAYNSLLWRNAPIAELQAPVLLLGALAVVGFGVANLALHTGQRG